MLAVTSQTVVMVCQREAGLKAKTAAPSSPVASSKNAQPNWYITMQVAAESKASISKAASAAAGEKIPENAEEQGKQPWIGRGQPCRGSGGLQERGCEPISLRQRLCDVTGLEPKRPVIALRSDMPGIQIQNGSHADGESNRKDTEQY